jgi:hypothetical protein
VQEVMIVRRLPELNAGRVVDQASVGPKADQAVLRDNAVRVDPNRAVRAKVVPDWVARLKVDHHRTVLRQADNAVPDWGLIAAAHRKSAHRAPEARGLIRPALSNTFSSSMPMAME